MDPIRWAHTREGAAGPHRAAGVEAAALWGWDAPQDHNGDGPTPVAARVGVHAAWAPYGGFPGGYLPGYTFATIPRGSTPPAGTVRLPYAAPFGSVQYAYVDVAAKRAYRFEGRSTWDRIERTLADAASVVGAVAALATGAVALGAGAAPAAGAGTATAGGVTGTTATAAAGGTATFVPGTVAGATAAAPVGAVSSATITAGTVASGTGIGAGVVSAAKAAGAAVATQAQAALGGLFGGPAPGPLPAPDGQGDTAGGGPPRSGGPGAALALGAVGVLGAAFLAWRAR